MVLQLGWVADLCCLSGRESFFSRVLVLQFMSVSMWTCSSTRRLGELRWSSWASKVIRELSVHE